MRRWLKRLGIALGGLLGAVIVAVLGAWAFANTETGRAWIADRVESALSDGAARVEVAGLSGPLPQRIGLERVTLSDGEGTWLTLQRAELAWRPWALLGGRFDVTRLSAERVAVPRAPAGGPDAKPAPADAGTGELTLPDLPVAVRIRELAVDRIELGAPLVGEAATLRLTGRMGAPVGGTLTTQLNVTRLDGPGGEVALDAGYDPATRALDLDLDVDGTAGPLLAGPLGVAPDAGVTVRLDGSGPIAEWRGSFTAALGESTRADLELSVAAARTLRVTGKLAPGALAPPPVGELLGGPVQVALDVTRDDAWRRFGVADGRITTPTADLTIAGQYDGAAGTIEARADLDVTEPKPLNARMGPAAVEGLRLEARAAGPVLAPDLEATVTADRLAAPDVQVDAARLTANLTPGDGHERFDIEASLDSEAVTLADPMFAAVSGKPLALDAKARLDPQAARVTDLHADAALGATELALRAGRADLADGRGEVRYALTLGALAAFDPIVQMGLEGRGTIAGEVAAAADGAPILDASVAGAFRDVAWTGMAALDALAGGAVQVDTRVRMGADGGLRLTETVVNTGAARLDGTVAFPGDFATMDAAVTGEIRDLSALGGAVGVPMAGSGQVRAAITGATADPAVDATVTAAGFDVAGTDLGTVSVDADLADLVSGLTGTVAAETTESPAGPVALDGHVALDGGGFRVRGAKAAVPGLEVTGLELDVPLGGGPMTGRASLASGDLGELRPLAGQDLGGRLDGTLQLGGGDDGQGLTADLTLGDVGMGATVAADKVRLRADVAALFDAPAGRVTVDLAGARAGPVRVESASLRADGGMNALDVVLSANGDAFGPLSLDAAAELARDGEQRRMRLTRFDAKVQDRTITLPGPATLAQGPDGLRVRDLALAADGGRIGLDLTQTAERVDAALSLEAVPVDLANLALAQPKLAGTLDGRVTVSGPLDAPQTVWRIQGRDVTATETDLPPLGLSLTGRLANGRLTTEGRVDGLSEQPVTLDADLPVAMSLAPFTVAPRPEGDVTGRVAWAGELAPIVPLLPVSGHRLGGTGEIDLRVGGTLAEPQPSGTVRLDDAVYENMATGTLLTDIAAEIVAEKDRLRIATFKAKDGGDGTVGLAGEVAMADAAGPRLDLQLTTTNAALIRRDEITAFADSQIAVTGTPADMEVKGKITVRRAEGRVPDTMPAEVADLNVTEVGGDTGRTPDGDGRPRAAAKNGDAASQPPAGPSRIALAINVAIPNRMFLRGRGLDTEWEGNLKVRGTAAEPIITGQLRAVRGRIEALSKTFRLDQGRVTFDGGDIDPIVDIRAVHTSTTEDLRVIVIVEGPASDIEFALSSQPELPEDEILSRLLFGKDATELSGAEAAQLGAAVAEFSGATGSGPGLLEKLRRGIGVDVLQFGGRDGSSVRAGQYLTDDVFVGVEQGLTEESGQVTVEVGITDNIAVESNVGRTGNSNVGLQFKWDY